MVASQPFTFAWQRAETRPGWSGAESDRSDNQGESLRVHGGQTRFSGRPGAAAARLRRGWLRIHKPSTQAQGVGAAARPACALCGASSRGRQRRRPLRAVAVTSSARRCSQQAVARSRCRRDTRSQPWPAMHQLLLQPPILAPSRFLRHARFSALPSPSAPARPPATPPGRRRRIISGRAANGRPGGGRSEPAALDSPSLPSPRGLRD